MSSKSVVRLSHQSTMLVKVIYLGIALTASILALSRVYSVEQVIVFTIGVLVALVALDVVPSKGLIKRFSFNPVQLSSYLILVPLVFVIGNGFQDGLIAFFSAIAVFAIYRALFLVSLVKDGDSFKVSTFGISKAFGVDKVEAVVDEKTVFSLGGLSKFLFRTMGLQTRLKGLTVRTAVNGLIGRRFLVIADNENLKLLGGEEKVSLSKVLLADSFKKQSVNSWVEENKKPASWSLFLNKVARGFLAVTAILTILISVAIIYVLLTQGMKFFNEVSLVDFLTSKEWTPTFSEEQRQYGILPLLSGTILVTLISTAIAVPFGVIIAIYLSEYAAASFRSKLKPALEVLAAVPTVVYGYFALTIVTPFLKSLFPDIQSFNALSAGIVMAIMILPLVTSLSEDAMKSVPNALRQASFGMGATRLQTAFRVILPASSSGVVVSIILAISRAIGETMIVTVAAGSLANLTMNPLESIQTITAYMVSTSKSDVEMDSTAYYAIFAAGLTLFVFTFVLNMLSHFIKTKYQEKYE